MSKIIIVIFAVYFILRLITMSISIKNEKALKKNGAVEYGKINSIFLIVLHILLLFSAITEAVIRKTQFDQFTILGIGLLIIALFFLSVVIYSLKEFWTLKIIIAKGHKLNLSPLFKFIRHPNYYLNVIPELIAIALICKAWFTYLILFPIYLIILFIRITQEERIMKKTFPKY